MVKGMTALDDNCLDCKKNFDTFSHSPHIQGRILQFGGWTAGWAQLSGSEGGGSRAVPCLEAGSKWSTVGTALLAPFSHDPAPVQSYVSPA